MFPEAFAKRWISRLTKPGDTVLDPFSGRGTTILTALLARRNVVACDVNEVAFCLSSAKAFPPVLRKLSARLDMLEKEFAAAVELVDYATDLGEFFQHCFHNATLKQIMFLRDKLDWRNSKTDNMIAALALGALHGDAGANSPYLSNQMPRTISMNPGYSVRYWKRGNHLAPERNAFDIIRSRAAFRYKSPIPKGKALVFNTDMRTLFRQQGSWPKIKCVITSPPYLNVTSFEEDQWLRLWFLGAPQQPSKGRISKDDRYLRSEAYWGFIGDMWKTLGEMVCEEGHVVIRIGSRSQSVEMMKEELTRSARSSGRNVRLISARKSNLKKRQTDAFRPGSQGCRVELDCHYQFEHRDRA